MKLAHSSTPEYRRRKPRPKATSIQHKSAASIQNRRLRVFILQKKVMRSSGGISNVLRWFLLVIAPGSACGNGCHGATRNSVEDNPEDRMSHRYMQVLDDLHVVGRNNYADVTKRLHFSTLEARDADCRCSSL